MCAANSYSASAQSELLVCGWDEVFALDFSQPQDDGAPRKRWSWKAHGRKDLPEPLWGRFGTTDECKPFDGGRKVLVTSSGGATAYINRVSDTVEFYATGPNAHSAEVLPGGRIAVALSIDSYGKGDRLVLYDTARPDDPILSEELLGGHGVVWDAKREMLWALSSGEIRVFALDAWESRTPRLRKLHTIPMPERGGHEMYPVPSSPDLFITTARHAWLFNRDTREFRPHPELGSLANVKCISRHPLTGQTAYIHAEGPEWWTQSIRFLSPQATYHVPGEHFYKVRWNVHVE